MTTDQILYGVTVVPAIIGLVQVAKDIGLPSHFAPAIAVLFGLLAGFAEVLGSSWPPAQAAVVGVALGLSASGLYSGSNAIAAALSSSSATTHLQDVAPDPQTNQAPAAIPITHPTDEPPVPMQYVANGPNAGVTPLQPAPTNERTAPTTDNDSQQP